MVERTIRSGHCEMGHHEGTRPKSPSGVAFRTCEALAWCACQCHKDIDKMFEGANKARVLISNPDYRPPDRSWWMPSLEERIEELSKATALKFEAVKLPETDADGDAPEISRKPRGQLEYWVKDAVEAWHRDRVGDLCTPKIIAALIAKLQSIPEPSTGAIHSVLMRWQKINYAMVGRNPVRFIGLTPEGMKEGLDRLKAKALLKERGVR